MTDKEIIVDDIDVSECSYYNPLGNYNCGGTKKCLQWSNCYYKQLKRKEQMLAKIRQILDVYYDDDWKATREIERILNDR